MNKILKIAIVVVLCLIVVLTIVLVATQGDANNGGTTSTTTTTKPTPSTPPACEHVDANKDYVCDKCEEKLEKPADPNEFTSCNDTIYVLTPELNARSTPEVPDDNGNLTPVTVKKNDVLKRTGYTADWSRVEIDGNTYYVSNKYVTVGKPITQFTACNDMVYYIGEYETIRIRYMPTLTTKAEYSFEVATIKHGVEIKRIGIATENDNGVDDDGEAYSIVWAKVEVEVDGKTEIGYINNKYLSGTFKAASGTVTVKDLNEESVDYIKLRSFPVYYEGDKDLSHSRNAAEGESFTRIAVANAPDSEGITWSVVKDKDGNIFFISSNTKYIEIK